VPRTQAVTKKELLERVTARAGVKRGTAKAVMEAVLEELRDILEDNGEVSAAPLGKLRVVRRGTKAEDLRVCRVKLHAKKLRVEAADPLAEPAE